MISPYELSECPDVECKGKLRRCGHHYHRYWDEPVNDTLVKVEIIHQTYECLSCGKFPTPEVKELDSKRKATKRFLEYVTAQALTDKFLAVSKATGYHNTSVRAILLEAADRWDGEQGYTTPKTLWLHRIKTNTLDYCVIADFTSERPVEVQMTRGDIKSFLSEFMDIENIDFFALDLHAPWREVVRVVAPLAPIFVPKFEILMFCAREMKQLFIWARRTASRSENRNIERILTLLRSDDLTLPRLYRSLLQVIPTKEGRVKVACELYLRFLDVLKAPTADRASELYNHWLGSIPSPCQPHLQDLISSIEEWRCEIFNSATFELTTDNQTRALRSHTRKLIEDGRGYDYEVFRAKLIYGPPPKPVKASAELPASRKMIRPSN
jgi:hypothetical protein